MEIRHDPLLRQFSCSTHQATALLQYRYVRQQGQIGIDFYHTWVPAELRGQGIAAGLTAAALLWGRQTGLPLQASCSYVGRFLVG